MKSYSKLEWDLKGLDSYKRLAVLLLHTAKMALLNFEELDTF